jgi:MFS family permease
VSRFRRPFYGWYIVGMAFISLFIGAGTGGFTFGIFLPAMSEDLGWSRSTIVVGSSLTSITAALVGPFLGRLVDQRGPKPVLIVSILVMGAGLFASGLAQQPWQYYLTFGLMTGAARSALQSVIPGSMIANWFIRRRSAAYGYAAMGPPTSNLLLPPVLAVIVATLGWRAGWMALASVGLIVGLLPAILIVRRRPEDMGLRPDGDPPTEGSTPSTSALTSSSSEDWTAREAIHSREFWMVAAGMALILLAPNVSIVFLFSYLSSKGIAPSAAAVAVSAVSAMQVLSRLTFWAPIIARVGSVQKMLLVWGGLLLCASLLLATAQGEIWAYVAAAVLGLGLGGNLVLQLQVWPEYFGRTAVGSIIGTAQLLQGMTSAIVPLLLAALLDHTGSYTLLYLIVSGFVVAGLALHASVGRPRRPQPVGNANL